MEVVRHSCDQSTATASGSSAFTPRTHADDGRFSVGIEVDDLHPRVHAAVGAACAGGGNLGSGDRGQRGLERILHRAAAGLRLPAEEAAAVVFES